jgi:hypothetical protein
MMIRLVVLAGLLALLHGCARYQISAVNNTVWRLDTRTGALEACGFEQGGRAECKAFPDPKT